MQNFLKHVWPFFNVIHEWFNELNVFNLQNKDNIKLTELFNSFMTEVPIKEQMIVPMLSKSMDWFLYDRDFGYKELTLSRRRPLSYRNQINGLVSI